MLNESVKEGGSVTGEHNIINIEEKVSNDALGFVDE